MQTAYDNFWMYSNSRHEPVQNLQKNDSYSYALLTDRYKNVQNGVHPRDSNNFNPPQNSVVTSLQNDHHRTGATNWPNSTYFQTSYANNFYTQNAYASETNNLNYLSQNTQQNCGVRCLQNRNVNVTYTPSSHVNTVISGSHDTTPRIRVKDVFSLNNNSLQDPLLRSNSYQTHSKKQDEYFTNYGRGSYSKTARTEAQSEFIDIQKLFLPQAGPPATQCYKPNNSVYQGNGEYIGNQLQNGRSRVGEVELGEKTQNSKTNSSDVSGGNIREKVISNAPSAEGINSPEVDPNRKLIQRTPVLGNNVQQHNTSDKAEPHLLNQNSLTTSTNATYQITPNETTHFYDQLKMPQTTIKITIPHTGESSFIHMNTTLNTDNNSSLSLPCLLESNNIYLSPGNKESPNQVNGKEKSYNLSLPQTAQGDSNNNQDNQALSHVNNNFLSPGQNQPNADNTSRDTVITSQKKIPHTKEPFIDVNRENIIKFLNPTPSSRTSVESGNENVPRETVLQNTALQNTVLSNALTPRRENDTNIQSTQTTPARSISEENLIRQIIKMEEYISEDIPDDTSEEEEETQGSEGKPLGAALMTSIEINEPVNFTYVKDNVPPTKELAAERVDIAQDPVICVEETETLENPSVEQSNTLTDGNSCEEPQEETRLVQHSYKCRINRDKLDMLIQFIKKDDEDSVRPSLNTSPANKTSDDNNKDKGEMDLNHNRRKLSKTCIVKNKNNSREMVSLLSHKIARGELLRSSSQSPQCLSPSDTNSEKSEEEKDCFSEKNLRRDDNAKCNPSHESQTEKDKPSKPESDDLNRSISQQVEGCSNAKSPERKCDFDEENDVINTMRALKTLQSLFCMSCNLSSSIGSFWINVMSAELRCLNCFKKMALKNYLNKPKTFNSDVAVSDENHVKNETNENTEKHDKLVNSDKERIDLPGEQIKFEQIRKEKPSVRSKRNSSKDDKTSEKGKTCEVKTDKSGEQWAKKHNVKEDTHKGRSSENISKSDTCGKTKRKDSVSNEDEKSQNSEKPKSTSKISKENSAVSKSHSSSHSKQIPESSEKKSVAKEQTVKHKMSDEVPGKSIRRSLSKEDEVHDERKDTKRVTDSTEKSGKRSKDSHISHKERNAEQSKSSKPKLQSPPKECCTCHKIISSERSNSTETKSRSTSGSSSEKSKRTEQPRKRKNSEEGPTANKVRVVEDHSKKDVKHVSQPSDKSKVSKDEAVSHKSKVSDNEKSKSSLEKPHRHSFTKEEEEHSKSKSSLEKPHRHSFTKEEEEHLKKDAKQVSDSCDKSKSSHHKIKGESTKQKTNDSSDEKVRRKSKDDHDVQKSVTSKEHTKSETKESSGGQSRKTHGKEKMDSAKREGKHGSSLTEAKDKRSDKKHFVGKIPKLSEKDKSENVDRPRKSDTTSKPLKESQNNKIKSAFPSEKLKNRESQEEKKVKDATQKRPDGNAKKEAERNTEKIKSAGRNQTENRDMKGVTESSVSGKRKKESSTLFAKLMKKTKKLSLSLLSEA